MIRASFGKVKITPEEPTPLQGYDPNENIADPVKDILDDLYARVLVLDDGRSRKVIVSIDCCLTNEVPFQAADISGRMRLYRHFLNTFPEGTRRSWGEAAGTQESSVSVHATHTHSAPEHFGAKYTLRIAKKIQEITNDLRPVKLSAATGHCSISVNRRPNLLPNDELSIDRSLHVIMFESEEGVPIGSIVNCAVHPTLLGNPGNRVSTEMVGLAMNELEAHYGNGFISLYIQGFSGDVGPFIHFQIEKEDTYPLVKKMGHDLFVDIVKTIEQLRATSALQLRSGEKKVRLPTREGFFKPFIDVTLHAIRMGDIVLFSTSCEVFNGYVGKIKRHFSIPYMMFSGDANGYCGYLPTIEAFHDGLGGYEMNTTPYTDNACDTFVEEAIGLIKEVNQI